MKKERKGQDRKEKKRNSGKVSKLWRNIYIPKTKQNKTKPSHYSTYWFLSIELIARKGQYLKSTIAIGIDKLGEVGIIHSCQTSFRGNIDHTKDRSLKRGHGYLFSIHITIHKFIKGCYPCGIFFAVHLFGEEILCFAYKSRHE